MKHTNKRAFTIIELVVVITVIAILAAVLIPTFSNLIERANVSNDTALIKNINTVLTISEAEQNKTKTMSEVIDVCTENGFGIDKLTPRSSGHILWDEENNKCLLVDKDGKFLYADKESESTPKYKLWKIVNSEEEMTEGYSYYISDKFPQTDLLEVSTGVDTGKNTGIKKIVYTNTKEAQNVTIKTNGGNLEINAELDTVKHYGETGLLNIVAVDKNSFYEFGVASMTSIEKGRIVFEKQPTDSSVVYIKGSDVVIAKTEGIKVSNIKANEEVRFVLQTIGTEGQKNEETTTVSSENVVNENELINANVPTYINNIEELEAYINSETTKGIILNDITIDNKIIVEKNKEIDLNGYVITTKTKASRAFWIQSGCESFVVNGTKEGSGMEIGDTNNASNGEKVWGFIDARKGSNAKIVINGGTYKGDVCASNNYNYGSFFMVRSACTLELNNIVAETDVAIVYAANADSNVKVNGGVYNVTGINAYLGAAFFVMGNAEFKNIELISKYGGCIQNQGTTTVENCNITVKEDRQGEGTHQSCALATQEGGKLTVKGGTYTAPYALYVYNSGGTIVVEDGTFISNGSEDKYVLRADKSKIEVKGGSFEGKIPNANSTEKTINIAGGTFSVDPTGFLAEGYVASENNGIWSVNPA